MNEFLGKGAVEPDLQYPMLFMERGSWAYDKLYAYNDVLASGLSWAHDVTGLPWWGVILAATCATRLALLPLNVYSLRNTSRMVNANVERNQLRQAYVQASSMLANAPWQQRFDTFRTYMSGLRTVLHKHDCYPWRSVAVPLLQLPLLYSIMMGCRHLVMTGDQTFEQGGWGWFADLTVGDPTYALPIGAMVLSYGTMELLFSAPTHNKVVSTASLFSAASVLPKIKSALQMWLMVTIPWIINMPAVRAKQPKAAEHVNTS